MKLLDTRTLRWVRPRTLAGIASLIAAAAGLARPQSPALVEPRDLDIAGHSPIVRQLPVPGLAFVENAGQWDTDALFVSRQSGVVLRAESDGLWIDIGRPGATDGVWERCLVKLHFEHASPAVTVSGARPATSRQHYFLGNDPDRWRSDVRVFEGLRWTELWPGIDLIVGPGEPGQLLEYRLDVAPGADLRQISIRAEGAEGVRAEPDGRLSIETSLGAITQTQPRSFERLADGVSKELPISFDAHGEGRYGFAVPQRDASRPLVIDPGLIWGTYVGGALDDLPLELVLDDTDRPLVVGRTWSSDFPTTPGVYQTTKAPNFDAFVTKLTEDGKSLVYSTYLGGSDFDVASGVALDPSGRVLLAGSTRSPNFPVTPNAFDLTWGGDFDVFVAMLSANGSLLRFGTYLGGQDRDSPGQGVASGHAMAIAGNGDIFVGGLTESADFPVTPGALFPTYVGGDRDGFVTRLSADLSSLVLSTFLPGNDQEDVAAVEVASDGSLVVAGYTYSHDFPTTPGSFDPVFDAGLDAIAGFLMKFDPAGTSLVFSTYFHGSAAEATYAIDLDAADRIAVIGFTNSIDLPVTPGAFDTVKDAGAVAFASIFSPDGSALEYSTYLGGITFEANGSAHVDLADSGVLTILSSCFSQDAPVTAGAYKSAVGSSADFHILRLDPHGSSLLYASYLGGDLTADLLFSGAVDSHGRAVVIGSTCCNDGFPLIAGGFDTVFGGYGPAGWFYGDGVVAKLELQPFPGVGAFGESTPACLGPIRLTALGQSSAGNPSFAVACTGAPPGAVGAMLLGAGAASGGLPLLGVTLYVDPALPFVVLPALADGLGYDVVPTPLPPGSAGATVYAQAGWLDTGGCGAPLTFSASDALAITVLGL